MVPSIARQSVIIKCNSQKSVLLGNYEFYYIGGLMNQLFGLQASEDMQPQELITYLQEQLDALEPKNEQEAYLIHMVKNYDPLPEYDEQMKLLFRWGADEKELWQVKTSYEK